MTYAMGFADFPMPIMEPKILFLPIIEID